MFNRSAILQGAFALVMGVLLTLPPTARAEVVTVTEETADAQGWRATTYGDADIDFGHRIAVSPLGRDSAEITIGSSDSSALLSTSAIAGIRLADLRGLHYSSFVASDHASGNRGEEAAPYLFLNLDLNNDGTVDDVIVFEPTFNGDVARSEWQRWDARNGLWHRPGDRGLFTMDDYIRWNPDATLALDRTDARPDLYGRLSMVEDWDGFEGASEAYTLTRDEALTFEFEDTGPETALEVDAEVR